MVSIDENFSIDPEKITETVKEVKPKYTREKQTQGQLIHELAKEMKKLLKNVYSEADKDSEDSGKEYVNFNIYEQLTPFRNSEEDPSPFPYCTIKFSSSNITDVNDREMVDVLMDFGIYYPDADRQYQYVFYHIFNIVRHRFIADNFLCNFRCEPEMTFALSPTDEDTYPYYFAGIGMRWAIPGIHREVDFWNNKEV